MSAVMGWTKVGVTEKSVIVAVAVWVTEFRCGTVTLKHKNRAFMSVILRKGQEAMNILGHQKEPSEGKPQQDADLSCEGSTVILCAAQGCLHSAV